MLVTSDMILNLVPDQIEAATRRKSATGPHVPRELAERYRDQVCGRIKELLREKGDDHTDVYMQGCRFYGRTDPVHGRTCLVAGEHNESDNCFFTIRQDGVFYHCHDGHAHSPGASVKLGLLVKPVDDKDVQTSSSREDLKEFIRQIPSLEIKQLESVLPKSCTNLVQVGKKGEPMPHEAAKRTKPPKFQTDVFSVDGLCKNGETTYIEAHKGAFWGKCTCNHGNHTFIGWQYDPTLWTNNDFRLDAEGYENITTVYNERYARPFNIGPETRIHFNCNPMGAGKTEQLKRLASAILKGERPEKYTAEMLASLSRLMKENTRILCIGPRITFDEQLEVRLADFGVRLYLDKDLDSEDDPDFMIYQFESLHKTAGKEPYTIVVMDEVESVLTQVTAGLNREYTRQNIAAFEALLRSADLVICLDAFLSKRSVDVVTEIINKAPSKQEVESGVWKGYLIPHKHVSVHYNKHRDHMKREYFIHKSIKSIRNQISISLAKGKRLAIVLGTYSQGARIVNDILRKIPNLRYRFYHRHDKKKSCDVLQDFKQDLNSIWSDLDVVLYTSKLTVGADFSVQSHFDELFMFMDLDVVSVRDYMQMSGRVRHVPKVHVYLSKPFEAEAVGLTLADIKHRLKTKQDTIMSTEREYMQHHLVLVGKTLQWQYTEDWLFELFAYNKLEASLSKSRMLQCFMWHVKEAGGTTHATDEELTPLPEIAYDWSRAGDLSPTDALKVEEELNKEAEQNERDTIMEDNLIETDVAEMSTEQKEARLKDLQGIKWSKEKSLLEFTIIYPEAEPTFKAQESVRKHSKKVSNMAVFLKKDLPAIREYEHKDGPLDALLDADEFLFTRLTVIKELFKLMKVSGFEEDIDGMLLDQNANDLTQLIHKAVGVFEGIRLRGDTRRILGENGQGVLSVKQIAGLVHQLLKSFLYCEFKAKLQENGEPKRVQHESKKYSVFHIIPHSVAGVPINVLARSCKSASSRHKKQNLRAEPGPKAKRRRLEEPRSIGKSGDTSMTWSKSIIIGPQLQITTRDLIPLHELRETSRCKAEEHMGVGDIVMDCAVCGEFSCIIESTVLKTCNQCEDSLIYTCPTDAGWAPERCYTCRCMPNISVTEK